MSAILTIVGISMLIFIHEAGHFMCARLAGVHVHVFSLGFGARIWGFVHKGTDYRISMLPLGGYVQVAGDDPTVDRSLLRRNDLHSKGFLARTLFYSGGVLMNLLFALIVFPLVFRAGVEFDVPELGRVDRGGAAWAAGLQVGDRIDRVNGKKMYDFNNMQVEVALANAKRGAHVVYIRGETEGSCRVYAPYDKTAGLRLMGVRRARVDGPYPITVSEKGLAYKAGLRDDDLLLEFGGRPVETLREYQTADEAWQESVAGKAESRITVKIRRPAADGGASEEMEFTWVAKSTEETRPLLGIRAIGRRVVGLKQSASSMLDQLGLRSGDEIEFVNDQPFFGHELDLGTKPGEISLVVKRGEQKALVLKLAIPVNRRAELADAIALGPVDGDVYVRPTVGSAADLAGVKLGDELRSINGKEVEDWDHVIEMVGKNGDKPLDLELVRASINPPFVNLKVTPRRSPDLGFFPRVLPKREVFQVDSFGEALTAGWTASMDLIKQVYVTLKKLFTGDVSPSNLGGIITIVRVSYHTAEEGYPRLFYFLALLSINLAVINVLPIPVLDGGHLMFLLIERIKGSPVSTAVHSYSQILGLVFVLLLLIYVTYNDILKAWF